MELIPAQQTPLQRVWVELNPRRRPAVLKPQVILGHMSEYKAYVQCFQMRLHVCARALVYIFFLIMNDDNEMYEKFSTQYTCASYII